MDRNITTTTICTALKRSLSARRAWIEIDTLTDDVSAGGVALRKESVDRNVRIMSVSSGSKLSLSARRAWIEIDAELNAQNKTPRRSPQGERG